MSKNKTNTLFWIIGLSLIIFLINTKDISAACDPATFDNYCADSENVVWCDNGVLSNYDCKLNGPDYYCVDGFCKSTTAPTVITLKYCAKEKQSIPASEWTYSRCNQECFDSDDGVNLDKKGYVKINDVKVGEDVCTSSTEIKEYYCVNEGTEYEDYKTTIKKCDGLCKDGVCEDQDDSIGRNKPVLTVSQLKKYIFSWKTFSTWSFGKALETANARSDNPVCKLTSQCGEGGSCYLASKSTRDTIRYEVYEALTSGVTGLVWNDVSTYGLCVESEGSDFCSYMDWSPEFWGLDSCTTGILIIIFGTILFLLILTRL